jgi:EF hand domain-containing protein
MSMFVMSGAAASSALDLISKLQKTLSASTAGASAQVPSTFDPAAPTPGEAGSPQPASAPCFPMTPTTMNTMLSVQGQAGLSVQGQPGLVNGDAFSSQLFSLLDGNGDGSISKSEFENAFGQNGNTAQADSIFAQLDANGDGAVSQGELTSALQGQQGQSGQQVHHHHHHGGGGGAGGASSAGGASGAGGSAMGGADDLLQGDTSQTIANSDGSNTTTITYADGSSVAMTTPAANGSGSAPAGNNAIEQMIQRQAQMLASSVAGQSLTMNV